MKTFIFPHYRVLKIRVVTNVPGGVFGTPSTRFYLRLLKLEVASQIRTYVRKPPVLSLDSPLYRLSIFEEILSSRSRNQARVEA